MLIDCDTCLMRDIACADCVVTFLSPPGALPARRTRLSEREDRALEALAGSGLVPPLRLVSDGGSRRVSGRGG